VRFCDFLIQGWAKTAAVTKFGVTIMSYDSKHIWFSNPAQSTPQIKKAIKHFLDFCLSPSVRDEFMTIFYNGD